MSSSTLIVFAAAICLSIAVTVATPCNNNLIIQSTPPYIIQPALCEGGYYCSAASGFGSCTLISATACNGKGQGDSCSASIPNTPAFVDGFYGYRCLTSGPSVLDCTASDFVDSIPGFTCASDATSPGTYDTYGGLVSANFFCGPFSSVRGDPQFVGLRGQSYQVHGIDGFVYNIISDTAAQVNTRFSFLEGPRTCPKIPSTGKMSAACWTHPGSYISEVAIMLRDGGRIHIRSGTAQQGFASVTVDNVTVAVNSTKRLQYLSTHEITVTAGPFVLDLESIDGFLNIRSIELIKGQRPSQLKSHGLIGQTWQNKVYSGQIKEIEGEVDDYVVSELFENDFIFNQFSK